ncbi:MAG: hypothetical protein VX519_04420 [Myxococcota bacterium]|nr:hypothetical protein [Myxococcota bacterium]
MIRGFRIVYTILTLNFFLPAIYYCFDAAGAASMFASLGSPFFVMEYPFSEDTMFWRILGIGNVATLGFCCALLLWDLQRFYVVLVPLVFLKSCSVVGFLVAAVGMFHPAFVIGALFDGVTVGVMVFFARGAYRELSL